MEFLLSNIFKKIVYSVQKTVKKMPFLARCTLIRQKGNYMASPIVNDPTGVNSIPLQSPPI